MGRQCRRPHALQTLGLDSGQSQQGEIIMSFLSMVVSLFGSSAIALTPGTQAPEFSVKNQNEKVIKLSELKGKPVIMYFYPKDDTPGCTKEACSFRDEYSKFQKLGAVVLGVSRQDKESKKKFI